MKNIQIIQYTQTREPHNTLKLKVHEYNDIHTEKKKKMKKKDDAAEEKQRRKTKDLQRTSSRKTHIQQIEFRQKREGFRSGQKFFVPLDFTNYIQMAECKHTARDKIKRRKNKCQHTHTHTVHKCIDVHKHIDSCFDWGETFFSSTRCRKNSEG